MTSKPTLRELYARHTGKVSDKWGIYLDFYERIFAPLRDKPITLVEVGVQNGGSLEIWSKFFAHAERIVGCDVNEKCRALRYDDPRISVVVGQVNSPPTFREIHARAPRFDIFLDDGSHNSPDIIAAYYNYWPSVKPGGLFVIEDLHCAYFPTYDGGIDQPLNAMNFLKLLADGIHLEHWKGQGANGFEQRIAPFLPAGAKADLSLVEDVRSVLFLDSICVIEKRGEGEVVRMGSVMNPGGRVIVGDQAIADSAPLMVRAEMQSGKGGKP
jgi:hypothetical protein